MQPSDAGGTITAPPTHRRWVGVLLSLLIVGAGIFLAGHRKAGLRWFLALTLLSFVTVATASLPVIPGLRVCVALASITIALTLWMLVLSFRAVPKLGMRGWLLFLLLAGALGSLEMLATDQLTRAFKVPTGSMEPTIVPGDRVLVQTSAYWFAAPSRADLVVFRTADLDYAGMPKDQYLAKRIVALPGETLQITNGHLLINGRALQGPPALADHDFRSPFAAFPPRGTNAYVVPAECFFVAGDNLTNSLDSRHFGPIPRRSVLGRATKIYWPRSRAGDLR